MALYLPCRLVCRLVSGTGIAASVSLVKRLVPSQSTRPLHSSGPLPVHSSHWCGSTSSSSSLSMFNIPMDFGQWHHNYHSSSSSWPCQDQRGGVNQGAICWLPSWELPHGKLLKYHSPPLHPHLCQTNQFIIERQTLFIAIVRREELPVRISTKPSISSHLGLFEGVSSFSYISAIVFGVSIIWKDQWGREGGSNVANVLWSSQVPPGPSPPRKSTTQNPLAAGNWLQIDILRAEHESWKYPPSKLVTPNQTRHHRDYNYILVFRWFTGIDHSSAVEWLSRRFIKYSPTLQPPGVGLAIICKKRESREGLEEWPKNIAKNWETLERKNITQLRKGHR